MSKTNSVANPATRRIPIDAINLIIPDTESPFYSTSASRLIADLSIKLSLTAAIKL
jgi:hypothetical protein